jgi:hypothetical protein
MEATVCLRRVVPVILLASLSGCTTQLPGMPTKEDFQRAQDNPIVTQPSLGGRITSGVTGEPIANAVVTVQGRTVVSSPTGHYGFDPNLTAGVFLARVTHPLYVDREREVEVKAFAMADFALQPK